MSDKNRARIGLAFVLVATILTTISLAIPSINTLFYTLLQVAMWILAAIFVIPFYMKRRIATMDEYKCPKCTKDDVCKNLRSEFSDGEVFCSKTEKGYDCLYVQSLPACSEAFIKEADDAFWKKLLALVPDAEGKDVSAAFLLFVDQSNAALDDFLKKGGAEAHVTDTHTRIRIAAAYDKEKSMLYVARPADGEEALFGKEQQRISTKLSKLFRGGSVA